MKISQERLKSSTRRRDAWIRVTRRMKKQMLKKKTRLMSKRVQVIISKNQRRKRRNRLHQPSQTTTLIIKGAMTSTLIDFALALQRMIKAASSLWSKRMIFSSNQWLNVALLTKNTS